MTDLPDFLLARIAEDAREAYSIHESGCGLMSGEEYSYCNCDYSARVLAECDAKRRIVEIESRWRRTKDIVATSSGPGFDGLTHVTWHDADGRPHEETVTSREFRDQFTEPSPPSETLRLLALPYADHPDYREEWKP